MLTVIGRIRREHFLKGNTITESAGPEGVAEHGSYGAALSGAAHKRKLSADGDLQVDAIAPIEGKGAALALPRSNSEPLTDRFTTYFAARAFRLLPIGGWPAPNGRFQDIVQGSQFHR
jgi:hypothetical protein